MRQQREQHKQPQPQCKVQGAPRPAARGREEETSMPTASVRRWQGLLIQIQTPSSRSSGLICAFQAISLLRARWHRMQQEPRQEQHWRILPGALQLFPCRHRIRSRRNHRRH